MKKKGMVLRTLGAA